eukprot:m.14654 g.14654  ORF g.14654 m.14654 type:complete len:1093 (+) comp5175_c0_seq1:126-3404(+)
MNLFLCVAVLTLPALVLSGGTSCSQTSFSTCDPCNPQKISGTVLIGASPVNGATIQLFTGSLGFVTSTTTNVAGYYEFTAADMSNTCGNYFVSVEGSLPIQPNWVQVAPASFAATAVVRDLVPVEVNFKFVEGACEAGADKKTILTTGYDRATDTPFGIDWSLHPSGFGPVDPFWTMTQEAVIPIGGGAACDTLQTPIPAKTRKQYSTAWHRYPDAEWLSAYEDDGINGYHAYTHCFCLNKGFVRDEADISLELLVDDDMAIISNGAVIWDSKRCPADGRPNNLASPSNMFRFGTHYPYPPGSDASTWNVNEFQNSLRVGTNCLTFQVNNNGGVVTGWTLKGGFKVPKGQCCVDAKPEPKPCQAIYKNGCFKGCTGVCEDDTTSGGAIATILNNTKVLLPRFSEMDKDGNKYISREEANEVAPHHFLGWAEITRGRRMEEARIEDRFVQLDRNDDGFISPDEFPTLGNDVVSSGHGMTSPDDKRCVPMAKTGEPMDADIDPESAEWERLFSGKCDCVKPPPPPPEPCCNPVFNRYNSLGFVFEKCEGECDSRTEKCIPLDKDGNQMDMTLYDPSDKDLVDRFNRLFGKCDCTKPTPPPPPPPTCEPVEKQVIVGPPGGLLSVVLLKVCDSTCTRSSDGAEVKCVAIGLNNQVITFDASDPLSVADYKKNFARCDCPEPQGEECDEKEYKDFVIENEVYASIVLCTGVCVNDDGLSAKCLPRDANGNVISFEQSKESLLRYNKTFAKCACPKKCEKTEEIKTCEIKNADGTVSTLSLNVPLCSGRCKKDSGEISTCEPLNENLEQIKEDFSTCENIKVYLNDFKECGCPPDAPPPPPPRQCDEVEYLPHISNPDIRVPTCVGKCNELSTSDSLSINRCKRYTRDGTLIPDSATADEILSRFHHCDCLTKCPVTYKEVDTSVSVIKDFPLCERECGTDQKCQPVDKEGNVLNYDSSSPKSMLTYHQNFYKCNCPPTAERCQPVYSTTGEEAKCPGECEDDAGEANRCTMIDMEGNQLNPLIVTPAVFAKYLKDGRAKCGCPSCRAAGWNQDTQEITHCTSDLCTPNKLGDRKCAPMPGFFAPKPDGKYQCNCVQ